MNFDSKLFIENYKMKSLKYSPLNYMIDCISCLIVLRIEVRKK